MIFYSFSATENAENLFFKGPNSMVPVAKLSDSGLY